MKLWKLEQKASAALWSVGDTAPCVGDVHPTSPPPTPRFHRVYSVKICLLLGRVQLQGKPLSKMKFLLMLFSPVDFVFAPPLLSPLLSSLPPSPPLLFLFTRNVTATKLKMLLWRALASPISAVTFYRSTEGTEVWTRRRSIRPIHLMCTVCVCYIRISCSCTVVCSWLSFPQNDWMILCISSCICIFNLLCSIFLEESLLFFYCIVPLRKDYSVV